MNAHLKGIAAGVLAGGLGLAAPEIPAQETVHARVSFDSGNSMVRGTSDAEWSYATINSMIVPGDTLWVDKEGTLELEMSGGVFLRMADESKTEVVALAPTNGLRLWKGAAYVQRLGRSPDPIWIETPVCRISIERDSQVRVDVAGNGSTTVSVRWGAAVVRAEEGPDVAVTRGQRSCVDPGYLPTAPAPFEPGAEDDFDAWNRERARLLAEGEDAVPAAVGVQPASIGVSDLAAYGQWVEVDSSYYWRPTVVADYVPYRYGHWSFMPGCGYAWVGDYPFCYVTTHYGRWWHHHEHGWLWTYRHAWGPAWVAGARCGPNFVWAPLDPWDRPCAVGADFYEAGGFRISFGASTYCAADALRAGPCAVRPCTPEIVRGVPPHEVHGWNMGHGEREKLGPAHRLAGLPATPYPPHRILRGPDAPDRHGEPARERVARLERGDLPRGWGATGHGPKPPLRSPDEIRVPIHMSRPARVQRDILAGGGHPPATSLRHGIDGGHPPAVRPRIVSARTIRDDGPGGGPSGGPGSGPIDMRNLPGPQGTRIVSTRPSVKDIPVGTPRRDSASDLVRFHRNPESATPPLSTRTIPPETKGGADRPHPPGDIRHATGPSREIASFPTRRAVPSFQTRVPQAPAAPPHTSVQPPGVRPAEPRVERPSAPSVREPARPPEVRTATRVSPPSAPVREPVRVPEVHTATRMPAPSAPVREPVRVPEVRSATRISLPSSPVREPSRAPVRETPRPPSAIRTTSPPPTPVIRTPMTPSHRTYTPPSAPAAPSVRMPSAPIKMPAVAPAPMRVQSTSRMPAPAPRVAGPSVASPAGRPATIGPTMPTVPTAPVPGTSSKDPRGAGRGGRR